MSHVSELDPMLVTQLRRPETRRRKRATPTRAQVQSLPRLRKIAIAVVAVGVVVVFAGRITQFALKPVVLTESTGSQIRLLEVQLKHEKAINDQIRSDIDFLKTPAGLEQEARRRGWVKPGEVALSMVGSQEQLAPLPSASGVPGKAHQSWADRVRATIDTGLAVFGGSSAKATR